MIKKDPLVSIITPNFNGEKYLEQTVKSVINQRIGHDYALTISDGSGMSRENKVTTEIMCKFLSSFNLKEPAGKLLLQSLATPGIGTLRNKFNNFNKQDIQIHAKSGYLNGVSTLSGYITFANREPVAFSIFANNIKGTVKGAKKMHEALVLATINYLD